jgi:hypothetical protein
VLAVPARLSGCAAAPRVAVSGALADLLEAFAVSGSLPFVALGETFPFAAVDVRLASPFAAVALFGFVFAFAGVFVFDLEAVAGIRA